ncbi:predicted protein [Streptomyces sp. C]|nr:predicted protein [Streptomyces sp. C]
MGPFRVLGVLGEGGMGRVLLGAAPDGRLVAVKQVLARFADDDGFRARFRREVAASRKVSGAYTAAVMEADADARTPWLASVFVSGPSLGAAVAEVGALPEETVRRLAAGLASALAEIHRAGLVHRDLKPENVLLAEDGVRVIDLGIARAAESGADTRLTHTGLVIGSPPFMSPEQAEGRELTPASDVFSLGSVLFLAATGRNPFAGSSTLMTLYDVVHAEPDLAALPAGLRRAVERCLAKDPAARPAPAELLGLLGPVVPAGRLPWPPAVHRMIAEQGAAIDRLLGAAAGAPARGRGPAGRAGGGGAGRGRRSRRAPGPAAGPGPGPGPGARGDAGRGAGPVRGRGPGPRAGPGAGAGRGRGHGRGRSRAGRRGNPAGARPPSGRTARHRGRPGSRRGRAARAPERAARGRAGAGGPRPGGGRCRGMGVRAAARGVVGRDGAHEADPLRQRGRQAAVAARGGPGADAGHRPAGARGRPHHLGALLLVRRGEAPRDRGVGSEARRRGRPRRAGGAAEAARLGPADGVDGGADGGAGGGGARRRDAVEGPMRAPGP